MLDDPTIHKAVQFAVATEDMGERTYSALAKKFLDDIALCATFSRLAEDEKRHRANFQALLDKLPADDDVWTDDERYRYLSAMSRSAFFADEEGLTAALNNIRSVDDALAHALEFEKATLGYYVALQDVLGQQEPLSTIIEAEKRHVIAPMKAIAARQ
ncbi:ferritin family protein [Planctomycetota bacterium]